MQHERKYELLGMSCGGCVNTVKKLLLELLGVEDAEVNLYPQTAVPMSGAIDVDELQAHLTGQDVIPF